MCMDYVNRAYITKAGINCAAVEALNLGVFQNGLNPMASIKSAVLEGKSKNIPEFSNGSELYADAIIQILVHCVAAGYPIGEAVVAKTQFLSGGSLK